MKTKKHVGSLVFRGVYEPRHGRLAPNTSTRSRTGTRVVNRRMQRNLFDARRRAPSSESVRVNRVRRMFPRIASTPTPFTSLSNAYIVEYSLFIDRSCLRIRQEPPNLPQTVRKKSLYQNVCYAECDNLCFTGGGKVNMESLCTYLEIR